MMLFFKKFFKYMLGIIFFVLLAININHYFFKTQPTQITAFDMNVWIKEVLKLSVLEIQVSQIHRFESKGIQVYDFSIPFTDQQSLVVTQGKVLLGYDLEKIQYLEKSHSIEVTLPKPSIQSMDLDFKFLSESDSFLNRIQPSMRNTMMADIKKSISESIVLRQQENLEKRTNDLVMLLQSITPKTLHIKKGD